MSKKEERDNDLIIGVVAALVVLALIAGLIWYFSSSSQEIDSQVDSAQEQAQASDIDADQLVADMNQADITYYYTETCPYCQDQKELFGDSFKDLKNTVDCAKEADSCQQIDAVPAWEYGGKKEVGVKTLDELREIVDSL